MKLRVIGALTQWSGSAQSLKSNLGRLRFIRHAGFQRAEALRNRFITEPAEEPGTLRYLAKKRLRVPSASAISVFDFFVEGADAIE